MSFLVLSDSVTSNAFNLIDIYTATNSMLKVQADGQGIWRAIGPADTCADIVFHRAYIVGGIQKMVQDGYIIRYDA